MANIIGRDQTGLMARPINSLASCGTTTGLTWSRPILGLYRGRVPIAPPDQREDVFPQPGSGRDNKPTCRLYRFHGCLAASPTGGKNWWFHRTILIERLWEWIGKRKFWKGLIASRRVLRSTWNRRFATGCVLTRLSLTRGRQKLAILPKNLNRSGRSVLLSQVVF